MRLSSGRNLQFNFSMNTRSPDCSSKNRLQINHRASQLTSTPMKGNESFYWDGLLLAHKSARCTKIYVRLSRTSRNLIWTSINLLQILLQTSEKPVHSAKTVEKLKGKRKAKPQQNRNVRIEYAISNVQVGNLDK